MTEYSINHRARVLTALDHKKPDRTPVDFLATPEVWNKLLTHLNPDFSDVVKTDFFDRSWEAVLQALKIDCRVISYDQFCTPPGHVLRSDARVDWWDSLSRSTPNRMWRQVNQDGESFDIWGRHFRTAENPTGAYEELANFPLSKASGVDELKEFPWPEPDWWDFSPLPQLIKDFNSKTEYHLRFRIGSVFEVAWQLRGMQEFLMDLVLNPQIPQYIMDRLTDVYVENTRRVLEQAGDQLDMVYFYDDVATQESLMISREMWEEFIRPRHQRIIDTAKTYGIPVIYHCDGAVYPLIPDLIEMGINVLNPIQSDAAGMDLQRLKDEFGDRLSFHGGVDIIDTLPNGTVEEVQQEVKDLIDILGENGGYIMASSHHIQSNTPIENVLAMYDVSLR
jgi:uroporphyrinogen decarboxylase